jgi:hypothetical protein
VEGVTVSGTDERCGLCGHSGNTGHDLTWDEQLAAWRCIDACADTSWPQRVERIVRQWPDWSPAERRRMDAIVAEVLDHCRSGNGNAFIREWCNRMLPKPTAHYDHAAGDWTCDRCGLCTDHCDC